MLVQLEPGNRILEETVRSVVFAEKRVPIDVKLNDFEGAQYWVRCETSSPDVLLVSVVLPVYKDIAAIGASDMLSETYGDLLVEPTDGSDIMLRMDLESIPKENLEDLVQVISSVRDRVMSSPFVRFFKALSEKQTLEPAAFTPHDDCPVFICPKSDRVVIVFALNVKENSDRVVTSVFLSEFVEARRKVPTGPIITFSETHPKELIDAFNIEDPIGNVGFVSFAILPRHVSSISSIEKAANLLAGFRTYIQYHIKCSKANFHSRMRARVASLLKLLNRAKNEAFDDGKKKGKKTFSGRTFEVKA